MRIEVANLTDAAQRIAQRLPDNPSGLRAWIGWDGQRIAVFAGVYAKPTMSLPNERLVFFPGTQHAEVETELATAAARLVPAMRKALKERKSARKIPRSNHRWRRVAGFEPRD